MKLPIYLTAAALLCYGPALKAQDNKGDGERAKVYAVADAHLDTQWNWDVQTTIKEYVWNTLSRNLFLLKKYPDYIFNFEGGIKYYWMKEYYPTEYEQMKEFIKSGRWHISGSSWEASDALVPSVESAIRNIMLGQTFYRQEFGAEGTDIFLPDCFGFGWTLPTIAAHCGLIGFSSQKLDWRNHPFYGDSKHPFTIGLWKGVDGSSIMLAHGYDYGRRWDNIDLSENKELQELAKRTPLNTVYRYYGTGDTGGSPTIGSVNSVVKGINGDGPLKIISATSDQLYKSYLPFDKHPELPVFDGELLMDVHGTGCYTSQAAMKLYNRQNEQLGDAAERAAVTAEVLGMADYPSQSLTESWRRFIFHQFHDDLTGTSIPRAYEFSWNDELISLKQFSGILSSSVSAIAERMDTRAKGTPILMYNPLGYEVTDIVEVEVDAKALPKSVSAYNHEGKKVAAQPVSYSNGKAKVLIEATVPATGYAIYDVRVSGSQKESAPKAGVQSIENSVYKITLDKNGDIVSLFDKGNNKEMVKEGKAIRLALFTQNESYNWPAWEIIKETIDASPISITDNVQISMTEDGKLRKSLCIEKRYGESVFRQYIRLYEGAQADRIDFYNEIDWQTTNALLKAEFPLNVENEKATYDLGLGSVKRGNNTITAYEVYAQQWADLSDKSGQYGVSIMNDSKYGWDKPDNNTIRLTLLHTPKTKGGYAYQDKQDLGYHTFTYSLIGHAGELHKPAADQRAGILNQRIKAFAVSEHKGDLGKSFSLLSSNNPNVAIKALKKAESGDEYVVRVYETEGKSAQEAVLTFARPITEAVTADGTEKTLGKAAFSGKELKVSIKPNGVNTYKVKLTADSKRQMASESLPLDYNRKCFSWNEFSWEGNFADGYSYAAELVPASMTVNRIPFELETKEELNGMSCKGDTLSIPAGKGYNKVYLLAAAATEDKDLTATVRVGKSEQTINVPSYTGFIGQWGHTGHTTGFLKDAEIAYTGTHRHSSEGDHAYEFTYMFKLGIDIPEGATELILPDNDKIVVFAATAVKEEQKAATAASTLFRTSNKESQSDAAEAEKANILKAEQIIAYSGFTNDKEKPALLVDGDENTKWCDISRLPNYVDFDLGKETAISGWKLVNAAQESGNYVTATCFLQGRNSTDEAWETLDFISGNKRNVVKRSITDGKKVRYLRLMVAQPVQTPGGSDTRIYELEVYE